MNRTYNIVWSYTRQAWVVASELASSAGRPPLAKKRALSAMVLLGIIAGQSVEAAFTPNVSAGQVVTGEVVSSGTQNILSGGSATSTTVNSGGLQYIADGSATSTVVNSGGRQNISAGGSATNTTVNSGGTQNISTGGSATDSIINALGTQNVSAGGSVTDTIVSGIGIGNLAYQYINSGGLASNTSLLDYSHQEVRSGGSAVDTVIDSKTGWQGVWGGTIDTHMYDGIQSVNNGGVATRTIIDGGSQNIVAGGSATDTEVNNGGTQWIISGGNVTGTVVNYGGFQDVSGGTATNTTLNGGKQHISAGGSVTNTTVNNGGEQTIWTGGSATSTTINSGGLQKVYAGSATDTTVNNGQQNIYSGGAVTNTTINFGGMQVISGGGSATNTTVNVGWQFVYSGGSATSTTVNNGAAQGIALGGAATSTTINSGGTQGIASGGLAMDTTVNSGGTQHVSSGGVTSGTTIHRGGQSILSDGAIIEGKVVNAGTLMLSDSTVTTAVTVSGSVDNSGTMIIGTPAGNTGSVLSIRDDYTGNNGKLELNSVLGNDSSVTDRLIIGGNATGKTDVTVNNFGGKGDQTVNGIEIVRVNGTSDTGAFYNSNAIRAGLYNYTVVQKGSNFYLTRDLIDPTDPTDPTAPTPGKDISTAAGGYIANLAAANQAFVTRLADREGGSEYINPVTGQRDITRLWLRQEGGHNRSRADVLRTTSNRYVAQLGGELVNGSFTDTDHWDLGLMAGYVNQQGTTTSLRSNYDADTKSQLHGYSTGLYGTWYQDAEARTGLYVGTWAQYSWFHNSVNEDSQASDSYKSKGFSASLETGYSWKVIDGERTDFFIQPQAQLIWSGIKADDHDTDTGTRVQGEGGNNLQSSLGVKAYLKGHSELDDNTGRSFKPFVEANWIHNTARYGVRMDGDSLNQDGAKDIVEVKTGVESQLSANTSIWGGVGVQIGNKGYSDTQGQLGLRVRF